jgi:hypothetical protein
VPDVLRSFVGHAPTRAVVVYSEERATARLRTRGARARRLRDLVLLVAPGRSEASPRRATHTGSLYVGLRRPGRGLPCAGVLRLDTHREVVEALVAVLGAPRPCGRRLAVVSDGGGTGAICAEVATLAGLTVPPFSDGLQERLRAVLPDNAGCSNPVDFAAATYDPEAYERVVGMVAESGEVDAIAASGVIGFWGARFPDNAEMVAKERASLLRMADRVRRSDCPLANTPESCAAVDELRDGGLPLPRRRVGGGGAGALVAAAEPPQRARPAPPAAPVGRRATGRRGRRCRAGCRWPRAPGPLADDASPPLPSSVTRSR